ncbi:O-antigen ligase family protein [Tindallia californiensis]|uniref:O-antigen ligase family protein n=1 Tax=Tindallia californiensis TaxID=159292 RepID=UPI000B80715D|nr:O-antigen ligase family protein [Tindallia californiensis]
MAKKKVARSAKIDQAPKTQPPTILSTIPIFLVMLLVPLVMRLKIVELDPQSAQIWIEGSHNLDFNAYWKMIFLVVLAVITGFTMVMEWILTKKTFVLRKWWLPAAMFSVLTLLSTFFSSNPTVARRGVMDHYEGMWAILAYMLLFVSTLYLVQTSQQRRFVLHGLLFSSIIIGIIGTLQWIGYDPMIAPWFQRMMLPPELHHAIADSGHTGGGHSVYATLGNSNYIGSFTALTIPVLLAAAYINKNHRVLKFLYAIASVLMLITLTGSQSRAGIAAFLAMAIITTTLVLIKASGKTKKVVLAGSIGMLGVLVATVWMHPQIVNRTIAELQQKENPAGLTDLWIEENLITMETMQGILHIQYEKDQTIVLKDETGNPIENLAESPFAVYEISLDHSSEHPVLLVDNQKKAIEFPYINDKFHITDLKGKIRPYERVEKWGFEGRESLGSRRGYTWSRTLPLLKDHLLIGAGPGNFIFEFPQEDFLGQLQGYNHPNRIVSNPHNQYLQIAIYTGLLSLVMFILLIGQFFWNWCRKKKQKLDLTEENQLLLTAITLGIAGYLIAAIFNDSIVAIAPVFWILLAMGIRLQSECNQEDDAKNEKTET